MGKRVVILFDLSIPPPEDRAYGKILDSDSLYTERSVKRSLERLGHEVEMLGVFDDIPRLIEDLKVLKPDIVFNMVEAFNNDRDLSPQVAGVLELLNLRYTGTKSFGLALCQDKATSKKILAHHRVRVPRWVTSRFNRPIRALKNFHFPAFVKLLKEESSEGISRDSYVENEKDCLARIKFLHDRYQADVMVEEFIGGREFYVGVMGALRPKVFPVRELMFREFPEDVPRFATFKAKWDEDYRKKWGIKNEFAKGLSSETQKEIEKIAKKCFSVLSLNAYARLDMRMAESGEIVVLEANPNPSIGPDDDFMLAAQKSGLEFDQVIEKIIDLA